MDSLGGYRIVRKLGEGPRAELLLARMDGESEAQASVAIKHYRPGVDDAAIAESISTEIEALARASGPHSVELLDVASAPSGQLALVLDRLPGGSLGRLLAVRRELGLGEVVTILAPLAGLVERMHAAGVVHRGIRLESVLFDRAGAPVLACFGRAELVAPGMPPAALEATAGALADQRALASLASAVLDRAEDPEAVQPLRDWLTSSVDADAARAGWGREFAELVLELAPAEPVDLTADDVPLEVRIPARVPLEVPAGRTGASRGKAPERRSGPGRREPRRAKPERRESRRVKPERREPRRAKPERRESRRAKPERREARLDFAPPPVVDEPWHRGIPPNVESWSLGEVTAGSEPWRPRVDEPALGSRAAAKPALDAAGTPDWVTALIPGDWWARVRASLAAVRVPVWIAAAVVGVALVAAVLFVPQGDSGAVADADPTPSPTPTQPGHGWTPTGASGPRSDPIAGDDPVAALVALLEARERCLAERSVLCLDAVGQLGSPALDDDQRLVRELQDGAETPPPLLVDAEQVTLVERLGDTALLELDGETQPASILLMRTEAGWRVRSYL